jgi:hypothetical protein
MRCCKGESRRQIAIAKPVRRAYGHFNEIGLAAKSAANLKQPACVMSGQLRKIGKVGLIVLVAVVGFFVIFKPTAPDGIYVAKGPSVVTGDCYYELSGGKVTWLDFENSGTTNFQQIGTYYKTTNGWFYAMSPITSARGSVLVVPPVQIKCSWIGLTFSSGTNSWFWRRRLIEGKRPDWMTLYLPWKVQ